MSSTVASPQLQNLLNQAAGARSGWRMQVGWVLVLAVLAWAWQGAEMRPLDLMARQRNLWVVIEDICGKYRIHDRGCDVAPAVDKAPAHRASLWTAATRYVTCPPLPDLEPTA